MPTFKIYEYLCEFFMYSFPQRQEKINNKLSLVGFFVLFLLVSLLLHMVSLCHCPGCSGNQFVAHTCLDSQIFMC